MWGAVIFIKLDRKSDYEPCHATKIQAFELAFWYNLLFVSVHQQKVQRPSSCLMNMAYGSLLPHKSLSLDFCENFTEVDQLVDL